MYLDKIHLVTSEHKTVLYKRTHLDKIHLVILEHKTVLWRHESQIVQNLIQLHKFTLLQIAFHFLVIWVAIFLDYSIQTQDNYSSFQLLHFHHEEIILLCVFSCGTYSGRHGTELGTYLSQFHRALVDDIAMIHINIDTELCLHWHTGSCWTFSSAPRHLLNFFVSATNILVSIIICQNTSTSFLRRLQYRLKTPALSYCSLLLFFAFITSPINRYYGNYQMSDLVWSCWGLS